VIDAQQARAWPCHPLALHERCATQMRPRMGRSPQGWGAAWGIRPMMAAACLPTLRPDRAERAIHELLRHSAMETKTMPNRRWFPIPLAVVLLVLPSLAPPAVADARSIPQPVPIPGGEVLGPTNFAPLLIHQFLPGAGAGFDGVNAEPNGITNFRGLAALAYTSGTATDNRGRSYVAQTDIRLYQGEYVAADGTHAHGTFVEI
jgi:hypothetical protein